MIRSVLECMGTFGITGVIAWIVLVAVLLIWPPQGKERGAPSGRAARAAVGRGECAWQSLRKITKAAKKSTGRILEKIFEPFYYNL